MTKDTGKKSGTGMELAVIGMAGRFPGAKNYREFWNNLKNGVESITFFSDEELEAARVDPGFIRNSNFVKSGGGVLGDKAYFDAYFYDYSPKEAEIMDPQMRIFHECCWEALEDAGYDPFSYKGLIGLYGGSSPGFYWQAQVQLSGKAGELGEFAAEQLANRDYLTGRVSYKLNLKGPNFTLNTACSTSLVAIHQACRALLTGECKIALAGGVSIRAFYRQGYIYQEGMIRSSDGHTRAFDARANGINGGEGAGIVVLKLLKSAMADRDHVHAVIKGSAINNDGNRKVGFTAPSVEAQSEAVRKAIRTARVEPGSITYIETHGTATPLGDPVEIEALKRAFKADTLKKKNFCALGSVKTNIGHLDAAAGVASFIKTVLALKNKQIPPSLHFETPNPKIDFENSPFYVDTKLKEWNGDGYPLRAGISSFGIGGTNAHVVLEEAPLPIESDLASEPRQYQLILLSAKTQSALDKMTENLAEYFKENLLNRGNHENPTNPGLTLADAAYTLQVGRRAFKHRRKFVCSNLDEAIETLSYPDSRQVRTITSVSENPAVIFMFAGVGAQYANMGRELYQKEPLFQEEMDRCFEILNGLVDHDIKEMLYPAHMSNKSHMTNKSSKNIDQPQIAHPMIFIFEYALAKLLINWGIQPHAMIGYSFGEYVTACLSGVFSLKEALLLVVERARLIQRIPGGAMLSVPLTQNQVTPFLIDMHELSIAIDNGDSCIVAGPQTAVDILEKRMKEKKYMCMRVEHTYALHSAVVDPILQEFNRMVKRIPLNPPGIPYISNVTGDWITIEEATDPGYWVAHLRQTVRFADGINELLKEPGAIFVEIGPGNDLSTLIRRFIDKNSDSQHLAVTLVRHPQKGVSDLYYLLNQIGNLWLYGKTIDWNNLYAGEKRYRILLPTYPYERQHYWIDVDPFEIVGKGAEMKQVSAKFYSPGLNKEPKPELEFERVYGYDTGSFQPKPDLSGPYVAPRCSTEQTLVETWRNFFGFEKIGVKDDFFELGGDSLKAITLISKIHEALNVRLALTEFFENSTIETLAVLVTGAAQDKYSSIEPAEEKEYYPLSPAQKRMYLVNQMNLGNLTYNMPLIIPFNRKAEKEKLEEVFRKLIKRHESLRTSLEMEEGEGVQKIHDQVEFEIEYYDLQETGAGDRCRWEQEGTGGLAPLSTPAAHNWQPVEKIIEKFVRPFALSQAPLLRVGLIQVEPQEYILMVDMHHIISDGVSLMLIEKDIMAFYENDELPELRLRYKDYSEWQNREEQGEAIRKQEQYWLMQFEGDIPVLNLPLDYERPVVRSFEGSTGRFSVEKGKTRALRDLAKEEEATMFMVLFTIFNVLLAKLSGQEDIIVGTGVAGRRHANLQHIIGMFVNTLPLRNYPLKEKTFKELLKEVKTKALEAFENQDYQFEDLAEKVVPERDNSRNPLVEVVFVLQSEMEIRDIPETETSELEGSQYRYVNTVSKFDITLNAVEAAERLLFTLEYRTKLFKKETIEMFIDYFKEIVSAVINEKEIQLKDIAPANGLKAIKANIIQQEQGDFGF